MGARKNTISSRSSQYWINKGFSDVEADKMAKSRMPGQYEYYTIFKKMNHTDALNAVDKWKYGRATTLENCILKYGETAGTSFFNEYRYKQAYSNSYEYKRDKYGWSIEQFNEYNKSRGVQGESNGNYGSSYYKVWVDKYGKETADAMNARSSLKKTHSYEQYLISANGDVELATERWHNYLKNFKPGKSNVSIELFDRLRDDILQCTEFKKIFYANNNQEWFVRFNNKEIYFIDFFLKDTGKVIEFYGDYWHANPNQYDVSQTISYPGGVNRQVSEIWNSDAERIKNIMSVPYIRDVMIIWESDFKRDKYAIINKCLEFLK